MAQRAEVIVYTISTNLSGTSHHGDKVLERIADATGGRSYVPFQITEVSNAFASIQEELRSQYAISYKPADFKPDGRYRTIDILAQIQGSARAQPPRLLRPCPVGDRMPGYSGTPLSRKLGINSAERSDEQSPVFLRRSLSSRPERSGVRPKADPSASFMFRKRNMNCARDDSGLRWG